MTSTTSQIEPNGPQPQRYLIVNADDFGMSPGVNQAIARSHEIGVVTSASLLVRWPSAADAVAMSRDLDELSLGLHVDLGEWIWRDGIWKALYEVVETQDRGAVQEEVLRQLVAFRELTGVNPTHVDSHQHVHRSEPVRSILLELAQDLAIPLRHFCDEVQHCGSFYGQDGHGKTLPGAVSVASLQQIIRHLPHGITELVCHPGLEESLPTMYAKERTEETRTLCDERIGLTLREHYVQLVSFADVTRLAKSPANGCYEMAANHGGNMP
jgi:chitin disaccharide deacetylase